MLLKMKTCVVQYGILISVFILLVLIVKILYFSTKNNLFLELVRNETSHKSNYNSTNGYNTETRQKPSVLFREEFKFDFTDPELHQDRYVRVKRDEAGTLQAQNIQAGRINTHKMYAKHVMADIVKASKVKAIVISIGKAFSVHKTNNPKGSPDTLILDRDGPDPSDSSVTIVLEREGHPVSINGHSMHEEEKHKLLKAKNSFVQEKSRNRNDSFDRFPLRRKSHWRNKTRRTRQQTVVPPQINNRKAKINREKNSVYGRDSKSTNVFSDSNMNRIIPAPRTRLLTNNFIKSESNRLIPAQITRAPVQFEKQNQDAAGKRNTLQGGQIPLIQKLSSAIKLSTTIQPATQVKRKPIFERRNSVPMPIPKPRLIVNTDRPRTKNPTVPNFKDKKTGLRKNSVTVDSDSSDFDSFESFYLSDWDSDRGSKWDESDYFDSDSNYDSEWSSEHGQDRKLPLKESDKATTLQNMQIGHNHPFKASNENKLLRNKKSDEDFKTKSDESGVYDDHEISDEWDWSNENEKETKNAQKTLSVSDNPKKGQLDVSENDSSDYEYYSYESNDLSDIKEGPTTARSVNSIITYGISTSQKRRIDFDYDSSSFEDDGERLYSKKAPETDSSSYEDDGERLYSKKTPADISIQKSESSNKSKFVSVKVVNIYKKKNEESDEWGSSNNFDKDVSTRKSLTIDKSEYIQKPIFKTKSEDKETFFSDSAEEWFKNEYSFSDEFYSSEEFESDTSAKDVTKNYKNNKNKSH